MTSERRTLIRRQVDRASAGVLRGDVSPYQGEVVELPEYPDPVELGTCTSCGQPMARHTEPGWSGDWWHRFGQHGRRPHQAVS